MSPIAWLPVAIFVFGIGNAPAIFMVFIALFFIMTLATITQIDSVAPNYLNVARTMGASKWQIYLRVILPAILPGLLVVLRLNLLGAWMVVLIAETTGVGYGLGHMIMLARNTFNPSLVFFTIFLIGLIGFVFDYALRLLQRRVLYWVPNVKGISVAADLRAIRNDEAALACLGVGKTWDAGTSRASLALTDIDLKVPPGEFVVVPRRRRAPLGHRPRARRGRRAAPGGRARARGGECRQPPRGASSDAHAVGVIGRL